MRVVKVFLGGLAVVGVVTLVRRGVPELQRYMKMRQM
jgi:hypothetical protein